jgi:hypothetical protein
LDRGQAVTLLSEREFQIFDELATIAFPNRSRLCLSMNRRTYRTRVWKDAPKSNADLTSYALREIISSDSDETGAAPNCESCWSKFAHHFTA